MRDLERIQERRVVQVEARRIAHVAGLGIVLVVVAFYAGVQVGKRAAASGALGPRPGESAAVLKASQERPQYTFEDVLMAPSPAAALESARHPEPKLPVAAWQPAAPAAVAPPAPERPAPPPATAARFTLQVKAFRTPSDADALAAQLRHNGYDAFVVPSDIPGKGPWHRVWVGRFETMEQATLFQRDFESREGFSTLVSAL